MGGKPQGGKMSSRYNPRVGFRKDYLLQTRPFDILALPLPENTSNLPRLGIPPLRSVNPDNQGLLVLVSPETGALNEFGWAARARSKFRHEEVVVDLTFFFVCQNLVNMD